MELYYYCRIEKNTLGRAVLEGGRAMIFNKLGERVSSLDGQCCSLRHCERSEATQNPPSPEGWGKISRLRSARKDGFNRLTAFLAHFGNGGTPQKKDLRKNHRSF